MLYSFHPLIYLDRTVSNSLSCACPGPSALDTSRPYLRTSYYSKSQEGEATIYLYTVHSTHIHRCTHTYTDTVTHIHSHTPTLPIHTLPTYSHGVHPTHPAALRQCKFTRIRFEPHTRASPRMERDKGYHRIHTLQGRYHQHCMLQHWPTLIAP